MLNIVERYTAEDAVDTDEGVVAIEYVVVAGAVVVALVAVFAAFGGKLTTKLNAIIDSIAG